VKAGKERHMRRLARFAAAATVVGSLIVTAAWTALAIAAAEPTSSCVATGAGGPPFYICTVYESLAGAHSELSDVVPIPPSAGPPVPSAMDIALFTDPALPPTDRTNWSDVIVFSPPSGPNAPFGTVQFLSNGCSSPAPTETDISCFPAAATQPPTQEIQVGTGYDSQDCTPFQAFSPQLGGAPYAVGHACSDATLNEPGANIPEVPMSFMLPVAAMGVFGVAGLKRRRKAVNKVPADLS
jgi:hypothetical protein